MSTPETTHKQDEQHPTCPLCGTNMVPRRRSALTRMKGFLLAYAAGFTAIWLLPHLDTGVASALALLIMWGLYMLRAAERAWCPECWFARQG